MGNRLSRIYTRTGDDGTTGLGDGSRTDKDSARIEAIGAIDELNSQIGLLIALSLPPEISTLLTGIQHELFDIGGEISVPGRQVMTQDNIQRLEDKLDAFNANLAPLKEFILPGGTQQAANCHIARSVCRRAERRLITLKRSEKVSDTTIGYMNRLSDLLFVLARTINASEQKPDIFWQPRTK